MSKPSLKWASILMCLLALLAVPSVLAAQTGRVTGMVTDSTSGNPIVGATVSIVSKPNLAAITGPEGRYSISNVPAGPVQLRAQRLGYAPQVLSVAVQAGESQVFNIAMKVVAVQLGTIVSVGYGAQSQRDVTGSVASVSTAALEHSPIVTLDQLLQGTSPGVNVGTASSEPGGALTVTIRGSSSITGSTEPLYVIDGFPIENDISGQSAGNGGRTRTTPANPLVTLNPSDIESMTILKDASSTAIYGARGANGVVIITTKQGRGTKPTFTLDYSTGTSTLAKKYPMLNAAQYMDYANIYGQNNSTPYLPFPDSTKQRILSSGIDTDWQDLIYRTGANRNLQMTVRGATNAVSVTRYSVSAGLFDQQGIVVGSGIRRLSTRANITQNIGTRVEFSASLSVAQARSKSTPTQGQQNANAGAVSAAILYPPILPVRRADGSYSLSNPDLNLYNSLLDAPQTPNPVSLTNDVLDSLSDTRLMSQVYAQAELLDNLKLRVSYGTDYANRGRNTYYPRTTMRGAQSNGDAIRAGSTSSSWLNENTLTYERTIGPSQKLTLLGGYTRQRTDFDGYSTENTNFVSDLTGFNNIGVGAQLGGANVSSRRSAQTLESWLARVNYSLLDKYLLTATVRRDGSSRFAVNKKYGLFPSVALAWRASSEKWLRNKTYIDDLKFRLSYGIVGNPSIRPYQSLARLTSTTYATGGTAVSGYYPTAVANNDLTWETTASANYGVDFAFLNRFTFTADYYTKKTTNLLLQVSLPFESGFQSALANRGSVRNNGVEFGFDMQWKKQVRGRGFGWRANVNYAANWNKVLDLGGPPVIFADVLTTDYNLPGTTIRVGQPIGSFFGFVASGVIRDSTAAAAITWKNASGSAFRAGQMKIEDLDGDGVITLSDRTEIGNPIPKFTMGLTNTLSYGRFELTALLQGVYGNKILNINRIRTESQPRGNVARDRYLKAWSPTNPDGKFPAIGENPNTLFANGQFTSNLLEDGSYLRLRALTLTFQVPEALARRSQLAGARVYITGTNLFTISHYIGYDPDVSSQSVGTTNRGIDIGAYPLSRSFTMGLSLNF